MLQWSEPQSYILEDSVDYVEDDGMIHVGNCTVQNIFKLQVECVNICFFNIQVQHVPHYLLIC